MSKFNINSIYSEMKSELNLMASEDASAFEVKSDRLRRVGQLFLQIVEHEGEDARPNPVYDKYAKGLKGILGKTTMVNVCYEMAIADDETFVKVRRAVVNHGVHAADDEWNGRYTTDDLGRALKARRDGRYNLTNGVLTPAPQGGGKVTKKAKREKARKVVEEAVEAWGVAGDPEWDFRYLPLDELKSMRDALDAEIKAREEFGATALKVS